MLLDVKPNDKLLFLAHKEKNQNISEVQLAFDADYRIKQFVIVDLNRNYRKINFSHLNIRPQLNKADFEFTLPELSKQEQISKTLYDLDTKILNLQNQNYTLEQIAQAIFKSWFVDFDGVTEFEDSELGKIPQGWSVKKIGDVIELLYGKSLTKENRVHGNIPVYGSSGIVGFHNQSLSTKKGIIVGRKGNVGSVYLSSNSFYAIDTAYYVKTELSLHYVYRNFQNQNFINSDSSVPGLSRDQAYSLPILIPKNVILEKFENISSKIQIILEKNKNLILTLTKTRDTLLPKLMSGEIRV